MNVSEPFISVSTELYKHKESFRLDKNLARNIVSLNEFIKENKMMLQVIIYIADTYQRDVFGFGFFDPYLFGKYWNYTPNFLRSKADNPYFLNKETKNLNEGEKFLKINELKKQEKESIGKDNFRLWDSILEDALYRLATTSIEFKEGGKVYNNDGENYETSSVRGIKVLNSVSAIYSQKSGSKKVFYSYEVNEEFLSNITKYYFKADKTVLRQLKTSKDKGLESLYIYLINLRDDLWQSSEKVIGTPYFDLLVRICEINPEIEPKEKKRKITSKINKIKKYVPDFISEFTYTKGPNSRFAYSPRIVFNDKFMSTLDKRDYRIHEARQRFNVILMNNLVSVYRKTTPGLINSPVEIERFKDWLLDGKVKITENRLTALRNTLITVKGNAVVTEKEIENLDAFIFSFTRKQQSYLETGVQVFKGNSPLIGSSHIESKSN